jgi:3-dehydroquinate synthetase
MSSAQISAASLDELILLSIELKAGIVSRDERERGERALLNYGHTLGHAIEAIELARGERSVLHGEAVAIGIAFAVRLAAALGRVTPEYVDDTDAALRAMGLDASLPRGLDVDELIAVMTRDKKAHHDLAFVLPSTAGFSLVAGIDAAVVRDQLTMFGG